MRGRRPPTSTLFPYTTLVPIYVALGDHGIEDGGIVGVAMVGVAALVPQAMDALAVGRARARDRIHRQDRKSTRLNSSHMSISYAVFCLKKKKSQHQYTLPYAFS